MPRYLIAVTLITALLPLSGCAVKEYDPRNPKEYSDYWNDEEHRKGSAAYPFTNDARGRDRGGMGPYGP